MTYRVLLIVAALLAMGTAAADHHDKGGMRGPNMDRLATVLELDDSQKSEVERIMTEHRAAAQAQREAFRASGERPDRETIEAHREAMRASLRADLEGVLTAEQLEKLDALHEMRDEMRDTKREQRQRRQDADSDATDES